MGAAVPVDPLVDDLRRRLSGSDRQAGRVAVAYSGGRDSTALLHAALRATLGRGPVIVAFHVHHGLSPHADAWLAHCRDWCAERTLAHPALRLCTARLDDDRRAGESIEAWARRGRYRALGALAHDEGVDRVWLAHHRRDQAETLCLQALRGGGVRGLAAMPLALRRDGVRFERPWLARSHDEIQRYARAQALEHIVDESNVDRRFARNRLRLDVWPALERAFPQAETVLATSAGWAQEAMVVLTEIAAEDLGACADVRGLSIEAWLRLSPARRSNALRAWLRGKLGDGGRATLVTRLLRELPAARGGKRWPTGEGELRLADGRLSWAAVRTAADQAEAAAGGAAEPPAADEPFPPPVGGGVGTASARTVDLAAPGRHALPGWGGELIVEPAAAGEAGLASDLLRRVDLRARQGGERLSLGPGRPARPLKKQFQALGRRAWERDGPLVYADGRLAFVPGLGMDGRMTTADPGARPMRLAWRQVAAPGSVGPAFPES